MARVQLPDGEPVPLATRYAHARLVFSDRRFSRAEVCHRDEPWMRTPISSPGCGPAWFIPLGAGAGFARYATEDVVVVSCWCAQANQ